MYDAILFDIDSKDTSMGMSCPPKEFLEQNVLVNVQKVLHQSGLFVLNLVLRNKILRPKVLEDLKKNFRILKSHQSVDDLNEVVLCSVCDVAIDAFEKQFNDASASIETFISNNTK